MLFRVAYCVQGRGSATLPTPLVPVTPPESSTTQAQRLSLLLSFRILYAAVSFGLTLGRDVSAKDMGVSRTSFTFTTMAIAMG